MKKVCTCLLLVLLIGFTVLNFAAAKQIAEERVLSQVELEAIVGTGGGGGGDPIPVGEFANRDWETYQDIKMTYTNDNYAVKYPKFLGEAHTIKDVVTPYYNGGSNTVTRSFSESNSQTYTAGTTVSVSYNVGFSFEGFSSGFEISASQSTSYETSTATTSGISAPVSPGNTLYIYVEGVYNVESGEMVVYDRTGGDANTWREYRPYVVSIPKGALVGTDEVAGSHYEPYWEYLANSSNLWGDRIWPDGSKYYNYLGGWSKDYYNLTKNFVWSAPHNTDGDVSSGVYLLGIGYDWNLPGIYGTPSELVNWMNKWDGFPQEVWNESAYKLD